MSENSRTHLKSLYGFDATVRRVEADRWDAPSPCEDWTAADVVAHNVDMNHRIAGFVDGQSQPARGGSGHGIVADWQRSFTRVREVLDRQGALQTVSETPWGKLPVEKFLGFIWVDPLIHTWDLARATGQQPIMDRALVEQGYERLKRAGDSLRGPGRFGPAVAEQADMGPVERFIAITGRDPGWTAAG